MKRQFTSLLSNRRKREGGFLIVTALVILFTVLLGGTLLASRSTLSIFTGAYNRQSQKARYAAESGTSYFTSTLNHAPNRWLMVVRNGDPDYNDSSSKDLWINRSTSDEVVELRQNPCIIGTSASDQPEYNKLDPNNAATKSSGYQEWFVSDTGSITSTKGNNTESFRLLSVERQEYAGDIGTSADINGDGTIDENDRKLSVWRDKNETPYSGVGKIVLVVEGRHYVGPTVASSAILETELEVTPKCCGVPFGGEHGNVDYADEVDSATGNIISRNTICMENNLGLGILAGAKLDDTGSISIKGKSTDLIDENAEPVNPIYCLASLVTGCVIDNKDASINVEIIDPVLPSVYTFCDNPTSGFDCSTNPEPTPLDFTFETSTTGKGKSKKPSAGMTKDYPVFAKETGDGFVLDAGVDASELPNACTVSADDKELHCNVASVDLPGGATKLNVDTSTRRVRLYFPVGSEPFGRLAGGIEIKNCSTYDYTTDVCSPPSAAAGLTTDLSMFGSPSIEQNITLAGTTSASNYYLYFPLGNILLAGDANITGVVWANTLGSNGNPTWTVPSEGLASVMSLMNQRWSNWDSSKLEPIFMEFIARSTNRHQWRSQ